VDPALQSDKPIYAGFWPRFGALLLDFLVFSPIMGLTLWLSHNFRLFNLYYFMPGLLIGLLYSVYLVRRYGGTPGKLLMGLRITRVDFSPIGYREAILRHAPDFILGAISSAAIIIASLEMTDSEYLSLTTTMQWKALRERTPSWYNAIQTIHSIWMWSELLVLLTNRKRRALHDFIAGTVVIRKPRTAGHSTSTS